MIEKCSLIRRYAEHYEDRSRQDRSSIENFFCKTLKVRNYSWMDLVEEIRCFQVSGSDFDRINALYSYLEQCMAGLGADELRYVLKKD